MENSADSSQIVEGVICHCGHFTTLKTSWTETNPGRRFRGCKFYGRPDACDFFSWLDPPAHPRYKSVINGLLRNKSVADKKREVVSWKFRIYQIGFWLLMCFVVIHVLL
ncbi:GRF-type domain-containing protein [Forsythia ovata]|uniref:GRF-type domain-containing protein n=1 Tax=Forsythia ovata TaxID=205694 RepID=A0ABD1VKI9_9LAMI